MSLRDRLRHVCSFAGRTKSRRQPRKNGRPPQLESLEDRMVPTILFKPQFGDEQLQHLLGSPVLNNDPPIYLLFWGGAEFSDGQGGQNGQATKFTQAAQNLFLGTYLGALAHYDASLGNAHIVGQWVDPSEPGPGFSIDDLCHEVSNAFDQVGLPKDDAVPGKKPLYVVVTSGAASNLGNNIVGFHT